jgi:hypothetical protein
MLEHILTPPLGMRSHLSDTCTTSLSTPPTLVPQPSVRPLELRPPCLVLDLALCPPKLLKSPRPSEPCPSTPPLQHHLPRPLATPLKKVSMKFPYPNKTSLGMRTALEWHQEQLLLARKKWDQKNRRCVAIGHIPSSPPTLISHLVPNVANHETTATNITHQSSPHP